MRGSQSTRDKNGDGVADGVPDRAGSHFCVGE